MKPYVIAFDIDGVLADCSEYAHLIEHDAPGFHAAMPSFPAIPSGVVLFNMLVTQCQILGHALHGSEIDGAEIPFVDVLTCRPERMRDVTLQWFEDTGLLKPRALHMRADGDIRPHHKIKMEMFEKHYYGKEEVLCLFEDNADTIKAFRDRGIACYMAEEYTEKPQSLIHLN